MIRAEIPKSEHGKPLHRFLTENGYTISMPCGGNGRCGHCRVQVLAGDFLDASHPERVLAPDENGMIPACRALCPAEGGAVALPAFHGEGVTAFGMAHSPQRKNLPLTAYGLALDIGTTTLALQLTDLKTGICMAAISVLNPQQAYGADVMSRIEACQKGLLPKLRQCLTDAVGRMIREVCRRVGVPCDSLPLAVAGNTVMLHIFMGVSPEGMAAYPFTPAFLAIQRTSGREIGLPCGEITVLPACSAFIGADITAGLTACGMADLFRSGRDTTALFTDWGTNGETVLLAHGKLYAASAAAGPAMEGGHIRCGVGGVAGAVNRVFQKDDACLGFTTVGNQPPIGFCTSGLVDWIAVLLQNGTVDNSGYLTADPFFFKGNHLINGEAGKMQPTGLYITGGDVREFQLAKAAIRAAAETLLAAAGIGEDDVEQIYLAGGIGSFVDAGSAAQVGLLPAAWQNKTQAVGNSALAGAVQYQLCGADETPFCLMAEKTETVDLNTAAVFSERFMRNITFEST